MLMLPDVTKPASSHGVVTSFCPFAQYQRWPLTPLGPTSCPFNSPFISSALIHIGHIFAGEIIVFLCAIYNLWRGRWQCFFLSLIHLGQFFWGKHCFLCAFVYGGEDGSVFNFPFISRSIHISQFLGESIVFCVLYILWRGGWQSMETNDNGGRIRFTNMRRGKS